MSAPGLFLAAPIATYRSSSPMPATRIVCFSEKQPVYTRRRPGTGETWEPGARRAAKLALDSPGTD